MKNKKFTTWTDVWKKPFKYDGYGYVWDGDNTMVFTVDDLRDDNEAFCKEFCENIVNVLNGDGHYGMYDGIYVKDGCDIYLGSELVGYFRGWGHLTGGLRLSTDDACELQDSLINYVIGKIKKQL